MTSYCQLKFHSNWILLEELFEYLVFLSFLALSCSFENAYISASITDFTVEGSVAVRVQPDQAVVMLGDTAVFICQSDLSVQWDTYKSSNPRHVPVINSTRITMLNCGNNSISLTIRNVTFEDAGRYICVDRATGYEYGLYYIGDLNVIGERTTEHDLLGEIVVN